MAGNALRLVISISASADSARSVAQRLRFRRSRRGQIQYSKGHKYLTLVYQIDLDVTRLLWVGKERTIESFRGFFTTIGEEITSRIVFICSDMWEPYLKVIRENCSEALHILDRFPFVAKMNKALDEVRAGESRRMASEGRTPLLKKSRWLLLKREENLKEEQRFRLRDLLRFLNYFRAQKLISSGVVGGLNNKAKVTMRKPYGFRTYRVLELALCHSLGKLPEPVSTHDFF